MSTNQFTDERLLFETGLAIREMNELFETTWNSRAPATLETLNAMEAAGRRANSAIIALRQRAAGVKAPKLGD